MFGLPVGITNTHGINALPFRCYNKVYNEWFRLEYIIDPVDENIGDGPDDYADYVLLRRAKRLDYFTGALPWPQRGPAVDKPPLKTFKNRKVADTFNFLNHQYYPYFYSKKSHPTSISAIKYLLN